MLLMAMVALTLAAKPGTAALVSRILPVLGF
jgi:hypothetical protein